LALAGFDPEAPRMRSCDATAELLGLTIQGEGTDVGQNKPLPCSNSLKYKNKITGKSQTRNYLQVKLTEKKMQKRINGNEIKYSKNDTARDKTNEIGDLK
jgi:hypothetical protein